MNNAERWERKWNFIKLREKKDIEEDRRKKEELEARNLDIRLHNEWTEEGEILPHPKWGHFSDKEIRSALNDDGLSDSYIKRFLEKLHSDKESMEQIEKLKIRTNEYKINSNSR